MSSLPKPISLRGLEHGALFSRRLVVYLELVREVIRNQRFPFLPSQISSTLYNIVDLCRNALWVVSIVIVVHIIYLVCIQYVLLPPIMDSQSSSLFSPSTIQRGTPSTINSVCYHDVLPVATRFLLAICDIDLFVPSEYSVSTLHLLKNGCHIIGIIVDIQYTPPPPPQHSASAMWRMLWWSISKQRLRRKGSGMETPTANRWVAISRKPRFFY